MCGICGIVDAAGVLREDLDRMAGVLTHRGPDDEGVYVEPAGTVGLGFRRLSIIDVAGGHQPLCNEDGSIWIVFNGEIYNFPELRLELQERGHRFETSTDTEVIVHLYEELGTRCLDRLNGMFAFAIWDSRHRRLTLARDRFGKKPLYYAITPRGLVFGSELRSLLMHPACPRELDERALARYLAFEYVPEPYSIVAGVHKLPAAHALVWERGSLSLQRYWEMSFREQIAASDGEILEEFRRLFVAAVGRRLLSDVPLGAFLSGGIDSSSVVAAMRELLPAGDIKTFSIAFREKSFDESEHARRVAAHFGTDHHEQTFDVGTMLEVLPWVAGHLDEPFADPSVLPTYLLSRYTREHVTVALGGDGADELLAGYPTFPADRAAELVPLPRLVHALLAPVVRMLKPSTENFSTEFKIKRFLRGLPYQQDARHAAWLGAFTPAELHEVLLRDIEPDPFDDVRRLGEQLAQGDRVQHLIALYAATYLRDDILPKVDRASMACSLEVRAPFLDYELVEFLGRVPSRLKLRRFHTKYLLKQAIRDRLPAGIAGRPKKGFGIPVTAWLRNELREILLDELSESRLKAQGLFDPTTVRQLVCDHLEGRRDHRKPLWALLMFQLWERSWRPTGLVPGGIGTRTLTGLS